MSARALCRGLAVAVSVAILAACSGGEEQTGATSTPASTRATSAEPSSASAQVRTVPLSSPLDHAHGLVVSSDGTLLVGSHRGVVRVDRDGTTTRVGQGADDLMGMTGVPGTTRLISSGHPGPGSTMPNPLGLMSSQDGGTTWTPMSLAGQVDFHALATDGQLIAGFDGMRGIRLSSDGGTTWTTGAPLAAAALAITAGSVWATTEQGLQRSADGGQTFTVVPDAPPLWLLASGSDNSLWGVDVDGTAWRSADGTVWERHAQVGDVEAIAVQDHGTGYAITATELHLLS